MLVNEFTPNIMAGWGDYDNDGDLDLLVTQEKGRPRLFQNDGAGTLTEVWVGTPTSQALYNTYQAIWADYDNDGFLDLLMEMYSLYASPSALFLNNLRQGGNQNHWLKVQLKGTASNAGGLGAKLRVQAAIGGKVVRQMRELGIFGGLLASDFIAHFGLGDATKVDVLRIEWPSGIVQELTDVAANQFLTIEEQQSPQPEQPKVTLASRGADGVFQAAVICATPGVRCVLEASTDLAQWTKVQVRTNLTGTMEFSDPSAATQPTRFYRVVAP